LFSFFWQPFGGVQQGDRIEAPFRSDPAASELTPFVFARSSDENGEETAVVTGRWKDGLFDCFRLGICHVSLWNAILCPQVLMAQVLTRMKMNWLGDRAPDYEWKRTFHVVLAIVVVYWILTGLLAPPTVVPNGRDDGSAQIYPHVSWAQTALYNILGWSFTVYSIVVLTKLRAAVRARYQIPNTYQALGPWEEVCTVFWCGCCAVGQVARQTCAYEQQPAACCSKTGLFETDAADLANGPGTSLTV
jgi:Cys-rich protein (TIGR01571 family)